MLSSYAKTKTLGVAHLYNPRRLEYKQKQYTISTDVGTSLNIWAEKTLLFSKTKNNITYLLTLQHLEYTNTTDSDFQNKKHPNHTPKQVFA